MDWHYRLSLHLTYATDTDGTLYAKLNGEDADLLKWDAAFTKVFPKVGTFFKRGKMESTLTLKGLNEPKSANEMSNLLSFG